MPEVPSTMIVELYCPQLNQVISSIIVPNGSPATLTGTIDLPAGDYDLCLRLYIQSFGGYGEYSGADLQVIVGQTVAEQEA